MSTRKQAAQVAMTKVGKSVGQRLQERGESRQDWLSRQSRESAILDEQSTERMLDRNFRRDQEAFREQSAFQASQASLDRIERSSMADRQQRMAEAQPKPDIGLGQQGTQIFSSSTRVTGGGFGGGFGASRSTASAGGGRSENISEMASFGRPRRQGGDDYLDRYLSGFRAAQGDY